ncbi:MAG TPA: hypothetical protein VD866_01040 [Urbifossiella sp.]|nr:hypothetical protein [Urbifossiella sp.]
MSALLLATEADLRAMLNDTTDKKLVGVQEAGNPPAKFGQWYYAVHFGAVTGDDPNALSLDMLHGVQVTITARKAYAPGDRRGQVLVTAGDVLDRAADVAVRLHMSYAVMNDANARITGFGVSVNGFVEPLKFGDISPPAEPPGDWMGGAEPSGLLVSTVTFRDARRVRPL